MAHVCLGHLGYARGTHLDVAGDEVPGDEVFWTRAEELAADFWEMVAQLRWVDAHLSMRPALAIWAGDFFMASMGFWEKLETQVLWPVADVLRDAAARNGRNVSLSRPPVDTDHPPMNVRRELLREHLRQALNCDADGRSELAIAHDMSQRNDDYIDALWKSAKGPFEHELEASLAKRA